MRAIFRVAVGAMALVFFASMAHATPITLSDTYDWDASTSSGGTTYTAFDDSDPISWSQTLIFSPDAEAFLFAEVELRHAGNTGNGTQELWLLYDSGSLLLGQLTSSSNAFNSFVTDTFQVPGSLLPSFPASQWTLEMRLADDVAGTTNGIALDYSTLTVQYDAVVEPVGAVETPEPATLLLLGSGLLGGAWRLRKRQSRNSRS